MKSNEHGDFRYSELCSRADLEHGGGEVTNRLGDACGNRSELVGLGAQGWISLSPLMFLPFGVVNGDGPPRD